MNTTFQLLPVNSLWRQKAAAFVGKISSGICGLSLNIEQVLSEELWSYSGRSTLVLPLGAGSLQPSDISEPFSTEKEDSTDQNTTPAALFALMCLVRDMKSEGKAPARVHAPFRD